MNILLGMFFILIGTYSYGQNVRNIKINQEDLDVLIIEAVYNNLDLDKYNIQIESNELKKRLLNKEHLGLVFVSGNLNEHSIQDLSGDNSVPNYYPRYNIGFTLPLNHFGVIKGNKGIITKDTELIMKDAEILTKSLEKEITISYINYLRQKNILNLKKRMEQFSLADFNAVEKKFSEGAADLNLYNQSRKNYYNNTLKVIDTEGDYLNAKIELESLVNSTLENLGIL
ncbi:MAG: TolC family protein [Reichenbachiella sp.]